MSVATLKSVKGAVATFTTEGKACTVRVEVSKGHFVKPLILSKDQGKSYYQRLVKGCWKKA